MQANPDFTRKSLSNRAKNLIQEEDDHEILREVQGLEKQGQMSRCATPEGAKIWWKALEKLQDEHFKFSLNSAVDTLPHNANLCLWKKREKDTCALCGERQTLIHTLNICKVARDARKFNIRHDAVLTEIVSIISAYMPATAELTTDLGSYTFPQHIVTTDLRPDIVWWDDTSRKLCMVELTVCFETLFNEAAERKTIKYEDIKQRVESAGYNVVLLTLEVGSRGIINIEGFKHLKEELNITRHDFSTVLSKLSCLVIQESFKIWCKRNTQPSLT